MATTTKKPAVKKETAKKPAAKKSAKPAAKTPFPKRYSASKIHHADLGGAGEKLLKSSRSASNFAAVRGAAGPQPEMPPVDLDVPHAQFSRADIEFHDVDHSGASFQARVYLNNETANEKTPMDDENGYAGSFNVLGHGGCYGEIGHCEINKPRAEYDPRPAHQLTPIKKVLIATDAVKRAIAKDGKLTVTVVPIITGVTEQIKNFDDVFQCKEVKLITYT